MEIREFIEKFAEAIEAEAPETLTPETIFRDLDEWSSLAGLSVMALADEEYGKEISGNDIRKANTIQQLFEVITSK